MSSGFRIGSTRLLIKPSNFSLSLSIFHNVRVVIWVEVVVVVVSSEISHWCVVVTFGRLMSTLKVLS